MDSHEWCHIAFWQAAAGVYMYDSGVIEPGILRLKVLMTVYFTCGVINVFPGLPSGTGYCILPVIYTLTGGCLMCIV